MLHSLKSNYQEIAKHFPNLSTCISSSVYKKQKLLEAARRGEPKPGHRNKEYTHLKSYTNKNSKAYDKNFDETIRSIRPDWFVTRSEKNKVELINAVKKGGPKPKCKSRLYLLLVTYTSKTKSYDKNLEKLVKQKAPHWLLTRSDRKTLKRKKLINLIKNPKSKKPGRNTELGISFKNFVCKSSYIFDREILGLVEKHKPLWLRRKI